VLFFFNIDTFAYLQTSAPACSLFNPVN